MSDIEIQYIKPNEERPCPFNDAVKVRIPFVGIYNSILDANIDSSIERDVDYFEEQGETYSTAEVDLKKIYEDYANFVIGLLGFPEGKAVYAGCFSPRFYNYMDDTIYIFIDKETADEMSAGMELEAIDFIIHLVKQADERGDINIESGNDQWYAMCVAIYDKWYDSIDHSGYEVIDNNIKYS